MARVRVCKFCLHPNPADEFFCQGHVGDEQCGRPLQGVPMIHEGEVTKVAVCVPTLKTGSGETTRDSQYLVKTERAILECPWGPLEISGEIGIGREKAFCVEAARFSDYMTVSSVHARVFCSEDKWFVRDLGSTNGTFLNGVKLDINHDHPVANGDQLNFSKSCRVVFRVDQGHE